MNTQPKMEFEHRRVIDNGRGRITVQRFSDGCRRLIREYEESWDLYVIVPRSLAIQTAKRNLPLGHCWSCPDHHMDPSEHYGGPGRSFSRGGYRVRAGSKRWAIFNQSGGLDV